MGIQIMSMQDVSKVRLTFGFLSENINYFRNAFGNSCDEMWRHLTSSVSVRTMPSGLSTLYSSAPCVDGMCITRFSEGGHE